MIPIDGAMNGQKNTEMDRHTCKLKYLFRFSQSRWKEDHLNSY